MAASRRLNLRGDCGARAGSGEKISRAVAERFLAGAVVAPGGQTKIDSESPAGGKRAKVRGVMSEEVLTERVDKWLWCVRIFKTRSLATDACRAGSVEAGGVSAKPARDVHAGEIVRVRQGLVTRTLVVRGVPPGRVGAKRVAEFCEDRTPPEEFEKVRAQRVQQVLAREKGSGRPTKRDRRALDRLFRP